MKKLFAAITLPLFMAWSTICVSDTCYTVEGVVKTQTNENIPVLQEGTIELTLIDEFGDVAFQGSAPLQGLIVAPCGYGCVILTHSTEWFDDGISSFTTRNDTAQIIEVLGLDDDETPCTFSIEEKITEIAAGTGFFEKVTEVNIDAPGYISNCELSGDNENEFDPITGSLCVE